LYYHQPSGLVLAEYRGYLPPLGRWTSRDPSKNAEMHQGPNLYDYVGNNSINVVDRLGLEGTWSFTVGTFDADSGELPIGVTYNMDSTERQCCKAARVQRYVYGPSGYTEDGPDGSYNYQTGLASASGDGPDGPTFDGYGIHHAFGWEHDFKFVAHCVSGNCSGKVLSTRYNAYINSGHQIGSSGKIMADRGEGERRMRG